MSQLILISIIVAIVAFIVAWFIQNRRISALNHSIAEQQQEHLSEKRGLEMLSKVAEERLELVTHEVNTLRQTAIEQTEVIRTKSADIAAKETTILNIQERLSEQKQEVEALQKRLTIEFENIANKILKERSLEFTETNQKHMGDILTPLKQKIADFEKKVDESYDKEMREKITLREEVRKLTELNTRISEEANNLTKALKGDVKKQGNWGEVILERVLERSGLTQGQEYEREEVVTGADHTTLRPDVIIHLPDDKHIVVDAKVSLISYERYANAETAEEQGRYIKEHCNSIRSHVKLLSEKNYQNALNINTPDFVLLFLPMESAFSAAIQHDNELYSFAWDRRIVVVSPTTLLATLRTIASIWKQENQTRHAQEIARLSGVLYDKFIGFAEDMEKIKIGIDRSGKAYEDALRKLKEGNGNIIRTAERIKELGAKTGNKSLPQSFL